MEKLIRLMTNNKTVDEQTNIVEEMQEIVQFLGVAIASLVVLAAMTVFC